MARRVVLDCDICKSETSERGQDVRLRIKPQEGWSPLVEKNKDPYGNKGIFILPKRNKNMPPMVLCCDCENAILEVVTTRRKPTP